MLSAFVGLRRWVAGTMNSLLVFSVVLRRHIFFGAIVLFVAPAAMLTPQRRPLAPTLGQNVLLSITVVAVTTVVMSLIRSGLFLLLVALFSFYLAFTGYRVLSRKTPKHRPSKADWTAASTMLPGGLALVAYGVYLITTSSFVRDVGHARFSSSPGGQMAWWYTQMTRMLTAYIATVTAFSVVNFQFLPPIARWLWATVAGTVGIVIWTRYYRRKFSGHRADRDVADLSRV